MRFPWKQLGPAAMTAFMMAAAAQTPPQPTNTAAL
jgi:hypothetical protein